MTSALPVSINRHIRHKPTRAKSLNILACVGCVTCVGWFVILPEPRWRDLGQAAGRDQPAFSRNPKTSDTTDTSLKNKGKICVGCVPLVSVEGVRGVTA